MAEDRKPHVRFNAEAKERYVESLAKHGWKHTAAKAAGVCTRTAERHRSRTDDYYDPDFDRDCHEAEMRFVDALRESARQRAQDGWVETERYDEDGNLVQRTRKYSDRLLVELLRRKDPAFRPEVRIDQATHVQVEMEGVVELKHAMAEMSDEELDALELLLKKKQERDSQGS